MNPVAITYGVLVVAVLLFVTNRVPVAVVALGVALSLWFTGVVDLGQALAGFGDPTVIFIATLFVVGEGLDAAGVTAWLGRRLIAGAGGRQRRVVVLAMLMVALLSALITPTGAVAALVPVAVVMCVRLRLSPSQLLMPLAFVAHAGSMLLLTGNAGQRAGRRRGPGRGYERDRLRRVRARRRAIAGGHHRGGAAGRQAAVAPAHPAVDAGGPQRALADAGPRLRPRRVGRHAGGHGAGRLPRAVHRRPRPRRGRTSSGAACSPG